jgi:3-oxoacyl-[acyl-carrier protein] reductase|nr:SDR family oxidoreductase [uncultured Allomuricauda sp.]
MTKNSIKKVVVLGGSSGIGRAISDRFAKEGWQVLIGSSNINKVRNTIENLPGDNHQGFELDVRNEGSIDQFLKDIKSLNISSVDVLVNSVGVSEEFSVIDSDFGEWDNGLQIMLYGTVKMCRALVPLLTNGGRIINITSIHYDRVERNCSSYSMAKAAITQFTRSLALELADKKILANSIAPGFINTPMSIDKNGENELESKWFRDNYEIYDHLPLKRAGQPEEVAGVAYFLSGPDASYMTGSILIVDGGLTITF